MASAPSPKKLKKADSTAHPELEGREFDSETEKALEVIDNCQNELESLDVQASEEILLIEQKFSRLRKPHLNKRAEMIAKVPHFWSTAFSNHPDLNSHLDDSEEECFNHLVKIEVEEFEDIKSGYKIEFHFEENPYFENQVLTKEFQLGSLDSPTSVSIPIRWKEGMDLTINIDQASPQPGSKRRLERRSFFAWYNDHLDPMSDSTAEIIKDDLWPNPLQYFLISDVGGMDNGVEEDEDGEGESNEEEDDSPAPTLNLENNEIYDD